ncbi:MAG: sulfide/dihydroorotate dehydrogenase-like FAD/NAD-binding protein [Nitrospirae bacterium]|nr:sulfide/dihydroorotate dehydrogenase-like FAD/NAD-binding protein [Nitrospirota bacterium]
MAKILSKRLIRIPDVFYYKLDAPLISKKAKAGQFVILRIHEHGERIPISLADINPTEGTISIIVMAVGKTTHELSQLKEGDDIRDLCGPLGMPTHIEGGKRVILVGGGFGVAPLYPIAKAFKAAGSTVTAVMGARSHDLLIYEKEMSEAADKLLITTDDGSRGVKGVVTDALTKELKENGADMVMAVGPAIMMKFVCKATEPFGVKTYVSLNPIMIDGSGMCGGCRVSIGGETKFACADGPDFDGHKVDWDLLMSRQRTFVNEEKMSFEAWKAKHPSILKD